MYYTTYNTYIQYMVKLETESVYDTRLKNANKM